MHANAKLVSHSVVHIVPHIQCTMSFNESPLTHEASVCFGMNLRSSGISIVIRLLILGMVMQNNDWWNWYDTKVRHEMKCPTHDRNEEVIVIVLFGHPLLHIKNSSGYWYWYGMTDFVLLTQRACDHLCSWTLQQVATLFRGS